MDNKENTPLPKSTETTVTVSTETVTVIERDDVTSRRSGGLPHTSSFRFGCFTKNLLAKAQTKDSCLSPGTLQNLVNPLRSQLGLPSLSLHKPNESPPNYSPVVETHGNDSGVDSSNSPSKMEMDDDNGNILNSFSETGQVSNAFQNLVLNGSIEEEQQKKAQIAANVTRNSITRELNQYSESRDQSTELPKFNIKSTQRIENGIPEVAAVIPTPKPKSKFPTCSSKTLKDTPKNQNIKPKLSSVKKSNWKFSSEHVQGKEYLIIKVLGKGGCGEVLLVIEKESRELFALKRVNLSGIADSSIEECLNEVQMLVDLRDSDLVVHIYAWEFNKVEKTMKIVMEHGQCDLQHSIKSQNWTALKLRSIWERILTIVNVIHKRGIVHADLKPANFVFIGDNLKIIDFGIASRLQQDHTSIAMLCPKGTLNFISPETIQTDSFGLAKIGPKSDIWSLGCILYLMVYGFTPFEHITHTVAKMAAICKGVISYPSVPNYLSSVEVDVVEVLRLCFLVDYRRRPDCVELLGMRLLRGN